MKKIIFNGKDFIKKDKRGAQRYNYQILVALDKYAIDMDIELLIPDIDVNLNFEFKHIKIKKYRGKFTTKLWQNIAFQYYIIKNNACGISLSPDVIPLSKNQFITIYDASIGYQRKYYKTKNMMRYLKLVYLDYLNKIVAQKAKSIITISNFSKNEIIKYYKAKNKNFFIIYCGWEHLKSIHIHEKILLDKYNNIVSQKYYFYIGGQDKRKNIRWIYKIAQKYPNRLFVIAGPPINNEVLTTDNIKFPLNLIYLGYISDEEMAFFMKYCQAFLFPSLYEGFGIPPLEALYFGARVLCSNSTCLPEIYKDYVTYFDPYDYDVDLDELLEKPVNKSKEIFDLYSWDKSAKQLLNIIKQYQ